MKTQQMISALSVATVLALASPAYAGLLGVGAGGGFGGAMGGGLAGVGGGVGGRGSFNGSLDSMNAHPTKPTADKVDSKTGKAVSAATSTSSAADQKVGHATASAASSAQGEAQATRTEQPAKSSPNPPSSTAKPRDPAPTTPTMKPATSASMAGSADQSINAGPRNVTGSESESLGAAHSPGSTSTAASGNVVASDSGANSPR